MSGTQDASVLAAILAATPDPHFSLGLDGTFSAPLLGCHVDDVFGLLGVNHPVPGRRQQRAPVPSPGRGLSMGNLVTEGG